MQILNILTTATPRPELHKKTIFKTIRGLNEYGINIKWFINLDCPAMIPKKDKDTTEHTLINFCKNIGIDYYLMSDHSRADFSIAAKRLYKKCQSELVDANNIFFWLEDDWDLVKFKDDFFAAIKAFFDNKQKFILTTEHRFVTGNPILFKKDFFDFIVSAYDQLDKSIDPEVLLINSAQQKYNHPERKLLPPNCLYFESPIFIDMGRDWRSERNIIKLNKYNAAQNKGTWT